MNHLKPCLFFYRKPEYGSICWLLPAWCCVFLLNCVSLFSSYTGMLVLYWCLSIYGVPRPWINHHQYYWSLLVQLIHQVLNWILDVFLVQMKQYCKPKRMWRKNISCRKEWDQSMPFYIISPVINIYIKFLTSCLFMEKRHPLSVLVPYSRTRIKIWFIMYINWWISHVLVIFWIYKEITLIWQSHLTY